ncbi:hypothetical protein [Ramlibacter tataouinensis]|nr:hypothetical protein [Ramlibacter tataouinensis]
MEEVTLMPMSAPPDQDGVYSVESAKYPGYGRQFSRYEGGVWHCVCSTTGQARTNNTKSSDCYNSGKVSGWYISVDPNVAALTRDSAGMFKPLTLPKAKEPTRPKHWTEVEPRYSHQVDPRWVMWNHPSVA